jgi:hypothetical protein
MSCNRPLSIVGSFSSKTIWRACGSPESSAKATRSAVPQIAYFCPRSRLVRSCGVSGTGHSGFHLSRLSFQPFFLSSAMIFCRTFSSGFIPSLLRSATFPSSST